MAVAGICLVMPAAGDEPGLKPEVAASLSRFGMEFVVGTYKEISDAGKSSVPPEDAAAIGNTATELVDQYKTSVRQGAFAANLVYTSLEVAITSAQVMGSATVAAAAPAAAVAGVARYGNEKLREFIVDGSVGKAAAVLNAGINSMSEGDRSRFEQLLKEERFVDAAAQFEQSTGKLSTMKNSLGGDARAQALLDKAVQSALAKGTSDAIKLAGAAYESVSNLEENFTSHVKAMEAVTEDAARQFRSLNAGMAEIKVELGEVKDRLTSVEQAQETTERQLTAIQDILFDEQPPSVKLALLDSGAKSALTDEQRSALRDLLTTQVKQQQIIQKASAVVGYARTAGTILSNLGINSPELGKAVQFGDAAVNALSQAFSGNILGAVGAISGLFGGGQDPIQKQFQEVFERLANLDKKLDEVLKLQQETLRAIEALSQQLAEVEAHLHQRLDRLDFEIARLNGGVQQAIWSGISGCANAWEVRKEPNEDAYDERAKRFRTYALMKAYTGSYGDRAYTCQTTLAKLFSGMRNQNFAGNPISLDLVSRALDETAGTPDEVQNNQYGKSALLRYRTELYQPSFDLLRLSWAAHQAANAGWGSLATAYAILATPSATGADLQARMEFLNKTDGSNPIRPCTVQNSLAGMRMKVYLCTDSTRYDEQRDKGNDVRATQTAAAFLQTPIVRDQVSELTKYAGFVAGPSDMAVSASAAGARTLDTIVAEGRASLGRELITGALMVSDVSIAQQAMIYGDLTAWFIAEQLWDANAKRFRSKPATEADQTRFDLAKKLLANANNPWLQKNVLMLILLRAEKACGAGAAASTCSNRGMLYGLGYDRFFPTTGDGKDAKLAEPDADSVTAAKNWWLGLFDIHEEAKFAASDSVGGRPTARRVLLQLDGYALPMPAPDDWSRKAFVYPPLMHERVADRSVLAQRLADYTVFDDMNPQTKLSVVRIANRGVE